MRLLALPLVAGLTALLLSCGGGNGVGRPSRPGGSRRDGGAQDFGELSRVVPDLQNRGAPPFQVAPPSETTLSEALAELDALPTPEGVDAALFNELKDALRDALSSPTIGVADVPSASTGETPTPLNLVGVKFVSAPPTGEMNRVEDLAINGTQLTWSYRNVGDYSQDGIVNIQDITPLAVHFNETADASNEWIDGNSDTVINIQDITPLAANFMTDLARYEVEGLEAAPDTWVGVTSVPFTAAAGEGRKRFALLLEELEHQAYRVVPYDSEGSRGVPSLPAEVPQLAPLIMAVTPQIGQVGEAAVFQASIAGVAPFAYAWNFGGGAEPNLSDEAEPSVTLGSENDYNASLTVTNAFGEDVYEFVLRVGYAPEIEGVSPLTAAENTEATFSAQVTGTEPLIYNWDFGVGAVPSSSTEASPTVVVASEGTYSCSVTISNDFGTETYPFELRTGRAPRITGVSPLSGESGEEVTFSAEVTGSQSISYQWSFGGGANPNESTEEAPVVTMLGPGEYAASLTASNDFGGDSLEFTLTSHGWRIVTVNTEPWLTSENSLAVVNGMPAISYQYIIDAGNSWLMFVRASDAEGSEWGDPVLVDSSGVAGRYSSLAVVDENPAISYYDYTNKALKYVRAEDTDGTTWGEPITVDALNDTGWFTSLAVVNGRPAISYYSHSPVYDLKYVQAADEDGTTWGAPVTVDSDGFAGRYSSLLVADGRPAVGYYDAASHRLRFARATDPDGASWGTPVTLDADGDVGQYSSLAVVNGNPAIGYYDATSGALKFVAAKDPSADSWYLPVTVDDSGDVGGLTSLAEIAGLAVISYFDFGSGELKFVKATDAVGISWEAPKTIDSGVSQSGGASMIVLGGHPAVTYWNNSADLIYALGF